MPTSIFRDPLLWYGSDQKGPLIFFLILVVIMVTLFVVSFYFMIKSFQTPPPNFPDKDIVDDYVSTDNDYPG